MKKEKIFKAGAEAVAKPMEKMLTRYANDMTKSDKEQKEEFDNFSDAVIEQFEKNENDSSNITVCPSLDTIAEDRDVTIVLEVINKYYQHPQYIKTSDSEKVIKEINKYARKLSLTEINYDIESISTLEEKEKSSLILLTLLCLLNETSDAYPEEMFKDIQESLYLANNQMTEIKDHIQSIVSRNYISVVLDFILGDADSQKVYENACEDTYEDLYESECTEDACIEEETFYAVKSFIVTNLEMFQDKFILNDEQNKKTINKKIKEIKKEVAEETVIGVLKYNLITEIMFTTYAFYCKEKFADTIEIPYKQLLEKGKEAIDENIAISLEEHTKFSIIIDDNRKAHFEDVVFENDILLNFFEKLITNVTFEMLPENDKYTLLAEMSQETKIEYLSLLSAMFDNKSIYKAEIYHLARELNCLYKYIGELDNSYNDNLNIRLDNLKKLIPYPSSLQVGYSLFKDYIEIAYRCSIYQGEVFKIKKQEAEIIEKITSYFCVQEPERTNFKNIALFVPRMIFERMTVKDFDDFQKKVNIPDVSKNQFHSILMGGGITYMFGLPALGILFSLNRTSDRINLYKQQRKMIDIAIQHYSDTVYLLEKLDKECCENVSEYYDHMIELLNENRHNVEDDIDCESNKVNGKVINKVHEVKNSMADVTSDIREEAKNIAQNKAKEAKNIAQNTAKEALKLVGGFRKKKR